MAVVLGLDPCLFLKNEEEIAGSLKYSIISDLVSLVDLAKDQNIKYLYHAAFDYSLPAGIVNVMKELEDDQAFIALMLEGPFKYLQSIYGGYGIENTDVIGCSFEVPLQGFVSELFNKLLETYHHGIVISDIRRDIQIGGNTYHFVNDIIDNAELSMEMLPPVTNYDDFEAYFPLYHWFYGREKYPIILSDIFIRQINKPGNNDQILTILTSLMRGIYFPTYLCQGHQYSIEAHPDSDIKTVKINDRTTILCRIHTVGIRERSGGLNRICYAATNVKSQQYIIAFHYNEDHCERLKHEETIGTPNIIQSEDAFTLPNGTVFAIKVKWR